MAKKKPLLPLPTRDVCRTGPRPCPHARCRHHLGFDINERGNLREVPGWKTRISCSLDIAEAGGGVQLKEIGDLLGVTRERARQLEVSALFRLHQILLSRGLNQEDVQNALFGLHPSGYFENEQAKEKHWGGYARDNVKSVEDWKKDGNVNSAGRYKRFDPKLAIP